MNTDCECIVVGAGVVGLAIAAQLARGGRDVLILEKEADFGSVTSARNSEVIHAGIYYPAGSLKARYCVEGKAALYRYCRERHINHRQCGKLIVATNATQVADLQSIVSRAEANGVHDLQMLDASDAVAMEPRLLCNAALYSPSTGIIDSHGLMLSLLGDAETHGAVLATRAAVESVSRLNEVEGFRVQVGGDDAMQLTTRYLINSAGHGASGLMSSIGDLPARCQATPVYLKGNYFKLSGKAPFSRLVYPVPEPGGLGVHMTVDLGGQARFGPDVEKVDGENYSVEPRRAEKFYAAVRQYWPALADDSLTPDYAGIRPKVSIEGVIFSDFLIQTETAHGVPGLVNLYGIESPGLTACLSIATEVQRSIK